MVKPPREGEKGHPQKGLLALVALPQDKSMSRQRSTHESMSIEAAPLSHIIKDRKGASKGTTHSQGGWGGQVGEEEIGV
jgi:hypothetical protein